MEDCIPSPVTVKHEMEEKELAKAYGLSSGKMAKRMYRLRQDLKKILGNLSIWKK